MKKVIFFSALYISIVSNAQVIDGKIENQINLSRQSNVDTFLVYSLSCNGGLIPLDTCAYENTQYLFWTKTSRTFLMRFDYCKDYKAIALDSLNPIAFYLSYKHKIIKEKIKPPTYYEVKKTKQGFDTLMNSITISHSCYHQFSFIVKKNTVKKTINPFDLDYKKFDNGKKNIYYSYNQQTKQKKLMDIFTQLIDELTLNKKFTIK